MMTMKQGILILFGKNFLNKEMMRFEQIKTKLAAIPIPKPFLTDVVMAKVGQRPKSKMNTGFSLMIPLKKSFLRLIFLNEFKGFLYSLPN